jgi:hypothetical protein
MAQFPTDKDRQQINEWVKENPHLARGCPLCGEKTWGKAQAAALVPVAKAGEQLQPSPGGSGGSPRVVVAVECENCGLVLTFSLARVKLPDPINPNCLGES